MRALLALACIAAAASPIAARAADIQVVNDVVHLRGPIIMGDATRFALNLQAAQSRGRPVLTVRLDSPGGLVDEASGIARQIRAAGLDTIVDAGGMCASACFLPFAAGQTKTAEAGGRVGVHSATITHGVGPDYDPATLSMALQAESFGVPAQVLARMAANPSVGMAWLSDEELASMGAAVVLGPAPVPTMLMGSNASRSTIGAAGNSWNDPATVKYDEAASRALVASHAQHSKARNDAEVSAAVADFEASPLHHAITGD